MFRAGCMARLGTACCCSCAGSVAVARASPTCAWVFDVVWFVFWEDLEPRRTGARYFRDASLTVRARLKVGCGALINGQQENTRRGLIRSLQRLSAQRYPARERRGWWERTFTANLDTLAVPCSPGLLRPRPLAAATRD